MSRRPVSTPVRALAAFSYLLPVAIVLLALPQYRQVRLIRVHAVASALLSVALLVLVLLFGSLRPSGLELAMVVGLLITLSLLGYFGAVTWCAIWAYNGRNPPVPGVGTLADRWEGFLGPRRVEDPHG
ncbi:MAG: hypothetical protein FJZ01_24625 [Candidatus Sericytochromatia bacterium]|nr:hypothetical protein [Candidatus Tanganyikabacteria bacterium]